MLETIVAMRLRRGIRFGVAVLAFNIGGEIAPAADPKDPLPLAIDFRKVIPKVVTDPAGLKARQDSIPQATDEELKDDEARGEQLHRQIMAKLRKVQRNAQLVTVLGGEPMFRLPHFTLTMASIGQEKAEKMQDLNQRELDAMYKTFPGYSPEHPVDYSRWANHPNAKPFNDERERIKAWFKQAVEEETRKYRSGESEAGLTLEKLRQETVDEMAMISAFQRAVRNEWHKRRHEPIERDWDDVQFDEEMRQKRESMEKAKTAAQHRRLKVQVTPVRTEYEVRPNEAAVVLFQVFKGRPQYLLDLRAPGAGQGRLWLNQSAPGEFQFPLMYAKAGTYQATLSVMDADWDSANASVTITVKGEPIPIPKEEQEPASTIKKPAASPTPAGTPLPPPVGNAPVQIVGTFNAIFFKANAELLRWDMFGVPTGVTTPVPLKITLDPAGKITGSANYELPASEMRTTNNAGKFGIYWRARFQVDGQVDWKSGTTHIDIKNGHDETGYETNVDGQGHWTNLIIKNYTAQLDGWTLPGPQADAWLTKLPSAPGMTEYLKTKDLEKGGFPGVVTGANGKLAFRDRGFFGAPDLPLKPGGPAHSRRQLTNSLYRYGPDGDMKVFPILERVKADQVEEDKRTREGSGSWYLKILGPATAGPDSGTGDPKTGIQAFGLWPTHPVRLKVGGTGKAQAMAVYRDDPYNAVDLSAKVPWTSDGLQMLGNGTFRATKPGTYSISARTSDGPQAMSSTLQVIVEP